MGSPIAKNSRFTCLNSYITKEGELKDAKILDALEWAHKLYEDGAVVETGNICLEIYYAIKTFDKMFERQFGEGAK